MIYHRKAYIEKALVSVIVLTASLVFAAPFLFIAAGYLIG